MPGFIGLPELLLLGLVVLVIFGPKRLPEMGRSMGRGLREFKESVSGEHKHELDRLVVPVEEPESEIVAVATGDHVPPAVERPLTSAAAEHERVA
jgi:sec-independent protein translocase protein TatA